MVFKFASGYVLPKGVSPQVISPQVIGERLESLCKENGFKDKSELPAKLVLEDARSTRSPLHKCFEWDNTVAAERYRLQQAGYLVRSVYVVLTGDDTPRSSVSAFASVTSKQRPGTRAYVPVSSALTDDDWREEILDSAERDFRTFKAKYSQLKELAELIESGEKVFATRRQKVA